MLSFVHGIAKAVMTLQQLYLPVMSLQGTGSDYRTLNLSLLNY